MLIDILSLAIHGEKATCVNIDKTDWADVLREAKAHDVQALLYTALKDVSSNIDSWSCFITELKRITVFTTTRMMQRNHEVSEALLRLKAAGIPVIAFKGIVLKNLYPHPELRTMGDADLLVSDKYIDLSKEVLEQMGFYNHSTDAKHIVMISNNSCVIELHWTLINHEVYDVPDNFEKEIWNNKIPTIVNGVEIFTLGIEDHLLFLCHHMRTHMLHSGFGIRQICDFVLFVESVIDTIDWIKLFEKAETLGIAYYASAILEVSERLFNLKVPMIASQYKNKSETIDELTDYILKSGNFGSRVIRGNYNTKLLYNKDSEGKIVRIKSKDLIEKISLHIRRIQNKYEYSRNKSFLMPVACLQYFLTKLLYFLPTFYMDRRRNRMFSNLNIK
jgi:hypothetical protein